jgi:probable F420-dependent oxidoreductase
MDLGVVIFPTDQTISIIELAREAEARGFESLWVTEHTHIPSSRKSAWPGGPVLPEHYRRTLDPYVALAAASAVTTTLRLATGICLVAQHDPIVLGKEIASVDYLSNGRFMLGVGAGWNIEEMEAHGVDPATRRSLVREKIGAMRSLWTDEEASYDGRFVHLEPSWSWPKPAQAGGPPVIMGGVGGPVTFRHVVEYCDGWMPIHGRRDILPRLDDLRVAADAGGRDPATIELGVFGVPSTPEMLKTYADAGFRRAVFPLPQTARDDVLAALDRLAPLLGTV